VRWENKNTGRWPILLVISVPKIFVNGLHQLIIKNVVTCFFLEHSVYIYIYIYIYTYIHTYIHTYIDTYTVSWKKGPTVRYFSRNFDKFRQLFYYFWPKSSRQFVWLKNCKRSYQYLHDITLWWRDCDVIEKCCFRKERNARIHSASTVASKFAGFKSSWLEGCQEYCKTRCIRRKTCMTDLYDFKRRIKTEWANLDHAVIAASVHQWRRCLSGCVKAGGGNFELCWWFWHCVFSDNYDLSYCRWSLEHFHANS